MTATASQPSDLARLDGKTAVVTGATGGIGLHTAEGLASLGARVIITGRDETRGRHAVEEIRSRTGDQRVEFVPVDHMTVGANQRFAGHLADVADGLDILVNNVGRVFPTRQDSDDGYEATLALCFAGPFALTEAALPLLARQPGGQIVNMSSSAYKMWHQDPFTDIQSAQNYVGIRAHAHAKLLNLIWTFALAERLRQDGTSVNATNPGAAWTPGTAQLTPQAVPAWKYVWPIVRFFQRRGSPAKAAQAPLRLIASSQFSGSTACYVEGRKARRPDIATNPDNQRRVLELGQALIKDAPTGSAGHRVAEHGPAESGEA